MDHKEAGSYWEGNAGAWTLLARSGYDIYRDSLNTPAFFQMLPNVAGLKGLDIGCGEGHNTRLLAQRGAEMWAIDIAPTFIRMAQGVEASAPAGIQYAVASAVELPFADNTFDFVTGFMSFMDVPELGKVISEAYRVLKPGGFLQISITHPCFDTAHRKNVRGSDGKTYAVEVGGYFVKTEGEVDEWIFKSAPEPLRSSLPRFKTPRFTRTLSEWLNLLVDSGFALERLNEPRPDDETVARQPKLQDSQVVAYFLHIRCRKPQPEN
jgi:ubiquinone/menaquinone biosynthesis C-methylase UbiE